MNDLILLSGPRGAGKSTVAGLLLDEHERAVRIAGDGFWHAIERGHIPPYLPESSHQNEVVVRALGAAAAEYAAGGYLVILETIIGPWYLAEVARAARSKGVEVHYVVLRPDLDTVLRRAMARPKDTLQNPATITQLHGEFRDLDPYEAHAIDSTELTAQETAALVRQLIASGRARLALD